MPVLDLNVKVTCGNWGIPETQQHLSQHEFNCSGGTLYCPKCPNSFAKSRDNLKSHIAKKHIAVGRKINHTCKKCSNEFPKPNSLRHHKNCYHTAENTLSGEMADMPKSLADAGDDKSLEEEIQSYTHFLVDSEIQKKET